MALRRLALITSLLLGACAGPPRAATSASPPVAAAPWPATGWCLPGTGGDAAPCIELTRAEAESLQAAVLAQLADRTDVPGALERARGPLTRGKLGGYHVWAWQHPEHTGLTLLLKGSESDGLVERGHRVIVGRQVDGSWLVLDAELIEEGVPHLT